MKIDDLPADDYVAILDATGIKVECRILGRTIFEENEYVICESDDDMSEIYVADARILNGQAVPVAEPIVKEVFTLFFNEHPDLMPESHFVSLTDEDGKTVKLEFLDLIEYLGKVYFVGFDAEDENADEVIILEVHEYQDMEEYLPVADEEILNRVFEMFKERNEDVFVFT